MKKLSFIFALAILLSFIVTINIKNRKAPIAFKKSTAGEHITAPNDHMLLQRSYPDASFDFVAYQKGQYAAKQHMTLNKSSRAIGWDVEGPGNIGGRFNCVVADTTTTNIIYAGAATGGIFKTIDGGVTWNPIFDSQPFLAIGCITIDPNNNSTIWAGTGDANISGNCYIGDGIYKSIDAGATWTNMGLNNQYVFSKIIVDPSNSNIIYAATMGQPFVRDANRGLFKSTNGGVTWNSILQVSNQAGIMDLVINPINPQILYAASYDRIRNNLESVTYGVDTKIWKTINGGTTWTPLTNGLPNFAVSRIGLTIYPSNPNILYAIVDDSTHYIQGIYKTIDGGTNWNTINSGGIPNDCYSGFGWYFGKIFVNPTNSNQIYVLGVDSYTTLDGGNTWNAATPSWQQYIVHGDQHDMFFIDGNTILLCTDGGIYKTTDNCASWTDIENIAVNQVYHANENPHVTNEYWCGVQDNGTSSGNLSTINSWNRIFGGDGFQSLVDPVDANTFYVEYQNGGLNYTDDGGINFYDGTFGIDWNDQVNWDMPYIMSKFNHTTLYTGTNQIYKMTGAPSGTWTSISPDLTDGLGLYRDDLHTITTISESPLSAATIYSGTADANVWVTTNSGTTWTNVTGTLPNRYVTAVKASPSILTNVYVAHSGYRDFDNFPHIHKSINNGTTWIDISGDLPQIAVNDILIAQGQENIIFISTDAGVYYTVNAGVNWFRLGNNMPLIPVFDIEFNTAKNKIIASTFSRSVQTIDITSIVGVSEIDFDASVLVYPNPITEVLKIKLPSTETISYSIYNIKGDFIKEEKLNAVLNFDVSVSDFAKGTYIIKIQSKNKNITKHFVKM